MEISIAIEIITMLTMILFKSVIWLYGTILLFEFGIQQNFTKFENMKCKDDKSVTLSVR